MEMKSLKKILVLSFSLDFIHFSVICCMSEQSLLLSAPVPVRDNCVLILRLCRRALLVWCVCVQCVWVAHMLRLSFCNLN